MKSRSTLDIVFSAVCFLLFTIIFSCSLPETFNPTKVEWPKEKPRFTQITADHTKGLALDTDGCVWTWGMFHDFNTWKKETTTGMVPVWNKDGTRFGNIKSITNAGYTCMAIDRDGVLWSWGSDRYGKRGTEPPRKTIYPQPVVFPDKSIFDNVVSVSVIYDTVYAVRADGSLWGWGKNFGASLKQDDDWTVPEELFENLDKVKMDYLEYKYGEKMLNGTPYPMQIFDEDGSPFNNLVSVAADRFSVLLLRNDGSVCGWGLRVQNIWPEGYVDKTLPDDEAIKAALKIVESAAQTAAQPARVKQIFASEWYSAALLDDGKVLSWGWNLYSALGHGTPYEMRPPSRMLNTREDVFHQDELFTFYGPVLENIQQISILHEGILVLLENGQVYHQGTGYQGNGTKVIADYNNSYEMTIEDVPVLTPVTKADGTVFTGITCIGCNEGHTAYMIDETGQPWAWGDNDCGLIGDGNMYYKHEYEHPYKYKNDRLYPVKMRAFYFDTETKTWEGY